MWLVATNPWEIVALYASYRVAAADAGQVTASSAASTTPATSTAAATVRRRLDHHTGTRIAPPRPNRDEAIAGRTAGQAKPLLIRKSL